MTEDRTDPRPPLAWMWWIPAILWAAGIFYLSTKPGDDFPKIDIPYLDKIVHVILYGALSVLTFCGFRFGSGRRFRIAALLAIMCASFYGLTDEFHQRFTVHRSCDIHDWYADTLGACVVFLTAFLRPKGPPPV